VTAYDMGYFDESANVTHRDIADELGIARSSLSSRLRRAERQLVRKQLGK
jgi:predicted DNA binding protein